MENQEMVKWALLYRDMGYSVIPVGADKKPILQSWKEYQSRVATEDKIRQWWTLYPDAQIGIVTGAIFNLVVIDVEKGGNFEGYPNTAIAKTGGDGRHFYCRHPGGVVSNKTRIHELTDIRGDGGHVVAPPSVSTKGKYEWLTSVLDTELATLPEWLAEEMAMAGKRKGTDWKEFPTNIVVEGERNNEATRYAGKLLHDLSPQLWQTAGWESLRAWNRDLAKPPLEEKELRASFESVLKMHTQS